MIFKFGEQLMPMELADWEADPGPAVFVTDSRHAEGILAKAGIIYENEIQISKIGFCRLYIKIAGDWYGLLPVRD